MPRTRKEAEIELDCLTKEQAADDATDAPMEEIEDSGPSRVVYENAPDTVYATVARVMKEYHKELTDAGVTVGCTFARAGKNKHGHKPAVMVHGFPKDAKVNKTDQKARLNGAKDAQIIFDATVWDGLSDPQRRALIDHELTHLVLKREGNTEDGPIVMDDAQRPKLAMRLHDTEIGVFKEVIERHGKDAPDWRQVNHVREQYAQLTLWGDNVKAVA